MAKHSVGLAITGDVPRRHRHHLAGNGRNQLIAHIDGIEESNAPAAFPLFDPVEEARMTRELCFDAADLAGISMIAGNDATARSPFKRTTGGPTRCRALMPRRAISIDPLTKASASPSIQLTNTSIRMKAVRHAAPPTVVAAFTLAQNERVMLTISGNGFSVIVVFPGMRACRRHQRCQLSGARTSAHSRFVSSSQPPSDLPATNVKRLQPMRQPTLRGFCPLAFAVVALSVTSLRRTIMSLLESQRTLIGTGTECIGRE